MIGDFIRNLIAALPVLGALLAVAAVNTGRGSRVRQTPVPFVAIVYSVVALFILYRFNAGLDSAIESAAGVIPGVDGLVGRTWLYIAENILVLLIFLVIKVALRFALKPLFTAKGNDQQPFGALLVARVYEYVPDYDMWFIARRFANLRRFYGALYWSSCGIAVLFITFAGMYSTWEGFAAVAFPAVAAFVIGEFYFALDGLTRSEYDRDILGERDSARQVANYGPLRKILREVFPDRVLSDDVHLSSMASLESGHRLGVLTRSDDDVEQLAGSYFDRLRQSRRDVDVNLAEASLELMRGNNVLIGNPFYADLTPYLALPAYFNLLQYRRCLIIVGRDALAEDLGNWIGQGLEDITGVPDLWNIGILSTIQQDDLDVGILRFADVHDLQVLKSNDDFLSEVEYVILVEPSRMLATGQLGLGLVMNRCSRNGPPACVAFDANHDGLVDALSHLVKSNITEVVASALPRGASSEVIWQAEGPHMHSTILPNVSRYLGLGTEIGAVALKYQVSKVHWVGSETFPVKDMMWIAGQYYPQINSFAELELSQDALREALVPTSNPWLLGQSDNYFLVVEDELANAYETIRQFATRAQVSGFINLISQDYLLRDYMVGNNELFSADPKAVPSVVPDFARTERNAVFRIILTLAAFGMSARELAREFELIGWPIPDESDYDATAGMDWEGPLVAALKGAIEKQTGIADAPILLMERSSRSGWSHLQLEEDRYTIRPGTEIDALIESLGPAYFYVEDEAEKVNRIGSLLFGHVYQALLPGQFITYAGKYYQVQRIGTQSHQNRVVLRRAADHIHDRRVYRNLRTFDIGALRSSGVAGARINVSGVELHQAVADIEVQSTGYLELKSRSALGRGRKVLVRDLPKRTYRNKAVLEIELPDVPPRVRKTIALLLNELFVTVFPYSHQYVVALTQDEGDEFGDLLDDVTHAGGPHSIIIVEDSTVDMGLLVAVERNWERFLEIITDYLTWNASPVPPESEPIPDDYEPVFPDRPAPAVVSPWYKRVIERLRELFPSGSARKPTVDPQPRVEDVVPESEASEALVTEGAEAVSPDPIATTQEGVHVAQESSTVSDSLLEEEVDVLEQQSTPPSTPDAEEGDRRDS